MTKSGLGTLNESLADVGDTEGGDVGRDDVVVDNGGEVEGDIVLGHADLLGNLGDLDLDVDLDEILTERVDLDQTGIDGLVELAELGDKAYITLLDSLEGVGAADAAGDGSHGSHAGSKSID
jgi:hypothetical protein